jgi:uncharacterized protein YigE (DUF2233 family)
MNRYQRCARLVMLLLLLCPMGTRAQIPAKARIGASFNVLESGSWRTIQRGIEYRKISFERTEPAYQLELKLLRLDPKLLGAKILFSAEMGLSGATAKAYAEKSGALIAVNANYFDEKGRPLAYLKTAEREVNRTVSKHQLYTGVFAVRDGIPAVLHRDEFQPTQASIALQSGPLLLNRGVPVEVMKGLGRFARRAVIGTDKEGRVIVAVTDAIRGGLAFDELQELCTNPRWQIETPDLLNLDGGGSAQLYVKAGKFEETIPGTSEVPVAIGFFTKNH